MDVQRRWHADPPRPSPTFRAKLLLAREAMSDLLACPFCEILTPHHALWVCSCGRMRVHVRSIWMTSYLHATKQD